MSTVNHQVTGRRRVAAPARRPTELTLSVPEAGKRYFNMSRNASYQAALRGDFPTVRIGRLLRVPVRALEAMLDNA
jgi:hypothetical protein